jgi:hypothetical protein
VRKNFSDAVVSSLRTFGRAVDVAKESVGGAARDIVSLKFQWREMLQQCWYLITVTALPAILMAVPFGVIVSVQVGNLIHQLGADSLLGAASGLGVIIGAQRRVRSVGRALRLVVTEPHVREVFALTGLDRILDLSASLDQALRLPAAPARPGPSEAAADG